MVDEDRFAFRHQGLQGDRGSKTSIHRPVLLDEVVHWLSREEKGIPGTLLDCTLGGAGHSKALLMGDDKLSLVGYDRDPAAVERSRYTLSDFSERMYLGVGNFKSICSNLKRDTADLAKLSLQVSEEGLPHFDGILLDLGISSDQLDDRQRGFSFLHDGPLDMRMEPEAPLTASEIVNDWSYEELCRVFKNGGLGSWSPLLSKAIVAQRPILSASQLSDICSRALIVRTRKRSARDKKKQHPATVVFQSLRIAVNDELQALSDFLGQVPLILAPKGRLAVISFHSLEDQLTARAMRLWSAVPAELRKLPSSGPPATLGCLLSKKPIFPSSKEEQQNSRARSARLRVFERSSAVPNYSADK